MVVLVASRLILSGVFNSLMLLPIPGEPLLPAKPLEPPAPVRVAPDVDPLLAPFMAYRLGVNLAQPPYLVYFASGLHIFRMWFTCMVITFVDIHFAHHVLWQT